MFTLEQIKSAHSKVKSGADFPAYIQEIKKLGVSGYETFVNDGHTDYFPAGNYKTSTGPKYNLLAISPVSNKDQFSADLKAHQGGKTDYLRFCEDCAKSGIEKWEVNIDKMSCTYFDRKGTEILVEWIPVP
jgi:uncharacterized protein YbcV (DUF1398 family)